MSKVIAPLSLYLPLWGAEFDGDGVGGLGGKVVAYVPAGEEWRTLQQTDVMSARMRAAKSMPAPPLCLVVFTRRNEDESIDAAIERAESEMLREARDAVLVLRLFKPGWFLEPEFAEVCFAVAEGFWQISRRPGPYRQSFLTGVEALPLAPYHLSLADLTTPPDAAGPIAETWELLMAFRARSGNASVEIALENFNRSYGFQLTPVDRLANLFVALDAMLGGMSAKRLGNVRLRRNSYRNRVQAAWLNAMNGGRGLRNAIAHGDHQTLGAAATTAAQARVQHIVRLLLRLYMRFALRWATEEAEISARHGLPARTPLAIAFNTLLEARAEGSAVADQALVGGFQTFT
jgi:hypothetical protein